ncbi:phosphonate C-P lyase system protein PhnH [Sphingomonas sp. TX0543]|jgi:alpha-D-ribose 1-methylphosphonate 5-triphosphate synthase subunit PhnH|uniref:phosphonate C-P lyase system protein PhnH n=1 Tax=Sphingomonadaceae TaxID=41297 RepID=UPI000F5FA8A9|nr:MULTISPECIES: phosphonate C-P lyase system protein PhnH [Sphingomonadaceae]MBI0533280.1 phosphonate C-P lyase system protein PhnH [Sphingomonas sp. TX0522]RQW36999.1 phosphonate C-P lyase system protein PhnH [Novosphingobium sp. LASN5T]
MTQHAFTPPASASLLPGFADPVFDSQATFRAIMTATAYPGRVITLDQNQQAPEPLSSATGALALTLLDGETSVWLAPSAAGEAVRTWLGFHTGVPVSGEADVARFAVVSDPSEMPGLTAFAQGTDEYPDRSTTLIIQVSSLDQGPPRTWRGPGIKGERSVAIDGLPDSFWSDWDLNRELYPAGVDIFFTCGSAMVGLPRTITVEI